LNVLGIIHRYLRIKAMSPEERKNVVKRVVVIGGKAAPGYDMAKRIIKLVCAVADKVNGDPDVGDLMKVFALAILCPAAAPACATSQVLVLNSCASKCTVLLILFPFPDAWDCLLDHSHRPPVVISLLTINKPGHKTGYTVATGGLHAGLQCLIRGDNYPGVGTEPAH
jgi:hypothetical protein